jgi:uncharacterized protein YecT (DUF1311 family)
LGWFNTLPIAIAPLISIPLVFANIHHLKFQSYEVLLTSFILWIIASVLAQSLPSPTDWKIAFSRPVGFLFWIIVVAMVIFMLASDGQYSWHKLFGSQNKKGLNSIVQKSKKQNQLIESKQSFSSSVDCRKVTSRAERLICNDSELSNLDVKLNTAYLKAKDATPGENHIKVTQMEWILKTRNACSDKGCMVAVMEKRIDELDTWKLNDVTYLIRHKANVFYFKLENAAIYCWNWIFGR